MFNKQAKAAADELAGTDKRILDAAGEVFAELGVRSATVRQICDKAGANIAAINYYFGDKEGLYLAVLRSVPEAQAIKYPSQSRRDIGPEQQLRAFVQALLQRVFDAGRPGWHANMIARELAEPTRGAGYVAGRRCSAAAPAACSDRSPAARHRRDAGFRAPRRHERDGPMRLLPSRSHGVETALPRTGLRRREYRQTCTAHCRLFVGGFAKNRAP